MSLYTHFTTEERELSMVLKAQGYSYSQIAKAIGKDRSSVYREFKRNSNKGNSAYHTFANINSSTYFFPFEYRLEKETLFSDNRFAINNFGRELSISLTLLGKKSPTSKLGGDELHHKT